MLLFAISKFGEDSSEKSQVLSSSPSGKKDLCDAAASKSLAPTMSPLVISSSCDVCLPTYKMLFHLEVLPKLKPF